MKAAHEERSPFPQLMSCTVWALTLAKREQATLCRARDLCDQARELTELEYGEDAGESDAWRSCWAWLDQLCDEHTETEGAT